MAFAHQLVDGSKPALPVPSRCSEAGRMSTPWWGRRRGTARMRFRAGTRHPAHHPVGSATGPFVRDGENRSLLRRPCGCDRGGVRPGIGGNRHQGGANDPRSPGERQTGLLRHPLLDRAQAGSSLCVPELGARFERMTPHPGSCGPRPDRMRATSPSVLRSSRLFSNLPMGSTGMSATGNGPDGGLDRRCCQALHRARR